MLIFDDYKLKAVTFENRIVMAPMSLTNASQQEDGTLDRVSMEHYVRRIPNGMGLC